MQLPFRGTATQMWLRELRYTTEPECMSILQTKAVQPKQATAEGSDACAIMLQDLKAAVDDIIQGAHATAKELLYINRLLDKGSWKNIERACLQLTRRLRRRMHKWNIYMPDAERIMAHVTRVHQDELPLFNLCARLAQFTYQFHNEEVIATEVEELQILIDGVAERFASFIDSLLGTFIRFMVESVININQPRPATVGILSPAAEQPLTVIAARSVVEILGRLSQEGGRMCGLLCREGSIRVLIEKCCPLGKKRLASSSAESLDRERLEVWIQALRALSMMCCVPEAVVEFEKARGVEFLTNVLCSRGYTEEVRAEAAGVIAQVTSTTLGCVRHLNSFLENMGDLIHALTDLCRETSSSDTFLLGVAALANATFADPLSVEYFIQFNTLQVLTRALQSPVANSVFAKDQVATVMANMATSSDCFGEVLRCRGVEILVSFLSEHTLNKGAPTEEKARPSDVEIAACERLQQKAAIALTRLSRDYYNAQLVVKCNGIPQLVQLCRDSNKRHQSGAVLVASLAALRKIIAVCGEPLTDIKGTSNATDKSDVTAAELQLLVMPKLMDSYMLCCKLSDEYSV